MASSSSEKLPPLWYSREQFADFWTALTSRVRQQDNCDQLFTGAMEHPLIALQRDNQQQILGYNLTLVSEEKLKAYPFQPTDFLIAAIKVAAQESNNDPPLDNNWQQFELAWTVYKATQRRIYAIAVATLKVGSSMHYARAVPFGAGTSLLTTIYKDNVRNTTRSLFALVSSLFTLKLKPQESFESYKLRFDLIISRFANWSPPIALPEPLLLFFVIRGLPAQPYGSIKNHILATDTITLQKGLKLLQDIGQSGANLINSTLGSGESQQLTPASVTSNVLAVTQPAPLQPPPTPTPRALTAAEKMAAREKRKTALCKLHGPCTHHGPKSLHATCECRDPQLLRRKKKKPKQSTAPAPVQQLAVSPASHASMPPPAMPYQHPVHMMRPQYQQPMQQPYPVHPYHQQNHLPQPYYSNMLLVTSNPYDGDEEDADQEDDDDLENEPAQTTFTVEGFETLMERISSMEDTDYDSDSSEGPPNLVPVSQSSSDTYSSDSSWGPPNLIAVSESSSSYSSDSENSELPPPPPPADEPSSSSTPTSPTSEETRALIEAFYAEPPPPPPPPGPSPDDTDSSEGPPGLISVSDSSSEEFDTTDEEQNRGREDDTDDSDSEGPPHLVPMDDTSASDSDTYPDYNDYIGYRSPTSSDNDQDEDNWSDNAPYYSNPEAQLFHQEMSAFIGKDFPRPCKPDDPFHVDNISLELLQAVIDVYCYYDRYPVRTRVHPIFILTPAAAPADDDQETDDDDTTEEEIQVETFEGDYTEEAAATATATHVTNIPVVTSAPTIQKTSTTDFEGEHFLDDNALLSLDTESLASPPNDKPQGRTKRRPDFIFPPDNSVRPPSPVSPTLPYDPSRFKPKSKAKPKAKRKHFRGHGWSKKGTKASRSRAKRKLLSESAVAPELHDYPPPRPPLPPPSSPTPANRSASLPSSPVTPGRPTCAVPTCTRHTCKKKYSSGYFIYCFDHRHLEGSPTPTVPDVTTNIPPLATRLVDPPAIVRDVTDHPSATMLSHELRSRALDLSPNFPRLKRARAVYAFAEGLHTVLHYPQQFLVTLRGEPAIRNDWSVSPCMLSGHASSKDALHAVLKSVSNPEIHPRSLCNHPACIYNQGDLITRKARHAAAIEAIDKQLHDRPTNTNINLVTHAASSDVILDTGAARHLHNKRHDFIRLHQCHPQVLAGFMGKTVTVNQSGFVDGFSDVLFMPKSTASVRSVGFALDRRGGSVTFTRTKAIYNSNSGAQIVIARRNNIGLYSVIPGSMPTGHPILISVPVQVRREAIHRLHQCLAHASIEKMRYIMKKFPQVCGSLTTRDLALFTTCPACRMGKSRKAPRPKSTYTRSTLFGHRLHADTTGVIRPATTAGYRRALIMVDDASRWIFVKLLRTASMHETAAAVTQVLHDAAADAHVLRTQIVRTDNGTEFINSAVQQLFAQSGIRHERTCPHTSHQNGVAERSIGKLMPVVRTMIAAASARPTLWGEAIHAAAHVLNRMPCSSNNDDASPYQIRFAREPRIDHLQPWGITAYVRRTGQQSKVHARADPGVLVGYGHEVTGQKGWRIELPSLRKVITSSSVSFDVSLEESVQRRGIHQQSTTLPQIQDIDPAADPTTVTQPAAAPPAPDFATVSQSPTVQSLPAPISAPATVTPHPICQRPTSGAPIQPSQLADQATTYKASPPSRPFTRSLAKTNTGASWSDVVSKADKDINSANTPPFPRPRGRPPSNHSWDPTKGEYVPTNPILSSASSNKAWIFAAMQSDLVSEHETPKTYEEAISGPDAEHWKRAIQEELASLKHCAVWKIIILSAMAPGAKPIPTKWVFKIKSDGHGNIVRYKARLVVCGYRQKFGRDYNQTFAPVAHAASIRMILALAVHLGLLLRQFDVKTAFLYGDLPKSQTVYLQPPKGVHVPRNHVLALLKSMYGLKQSSFLWNRHLHNTLTKLKFRRSVHDPCVYSLKTDDGECIFLAIVVDDILAASSSIRLLNQFEQDLKRSYKITSLGVPRRLVGLNITHFDNGLSLDQIQFVKDVAAQFKQTQSKPVSSPMALGEVPLGASPDLPPGHKYLSLVGSLLWASLTRPDIAVAVSIACTKSIRPTKADLAAALRILRYLLHTPHVKLTYIRSATAPTFCTYVDAAWANAPKSRSRYGYIVCIHGAPVMWETKCTTMVCLSTAEAEYVAAVHAAKSAIWLANMTAELCSTTMSPITLLEDNNACIQMASNPVVSGRNRHFAMRMWWLRDQVENKRVVFAHVPTDKQLADILTKLMPQPRFIALRDIIMSGKGMTNTSSC